MICVTKSVIAGLNPAMMGEQSTGGRRANVMTNSRTARKENGAGALVPEMLTGHVLMMRLAAAADGFLGQDADVPHRSLHAVRTAGLAARLMDRYRRGMMLLDCLSRADPDGAFVASVRTHWTDCRAPAAGGDRAEAAALPPAPVVPDGGLGRLRHGNPPGDFRAAPRCGARTRAGGCCRQPAMANGRCRLHGGKSTGPRTAAGLARSRAARLVHGGRSAAAIALRAEAAATARRLDALIAAAGDVSAGHGVDRSILPSLPLAKKGADGGPGDPASAGPPADVRGDVPAQRPADLPEPHRALPAAPSTAPSETPPPPDLLQE